MNNLILTSIGIDEFKTFISDCIRLELASSNKPNLEPQDELITESEAQVLLQVSKVTLKAWRDEGKIPFYRYGTRIRYKRLELLNSATTPKKYGRK